MAIINPYNYSRPVSGINFKLQMAGNSDANGEKNNQIRPVRLSRPILSQQDKYLEQKIMSAKPGDLVMLLYEGLIKFIKHSKMYLEENNIEKLNDSALRAQAIVSELQSTLDMDYAISSQLDSLYSFIYIKLTEGNVKKDMKCFDDALEISNSMLEMWNEVIKAPRA